MTVFNQLYLFIFNSYKKKYKQKANTIALYYVSTLQISLVFLLGTFFITFLSQMNSVTPSSGKSLAFFIIVAVCIHFSNWIAYSGKSRVVMNAKYKKSKVTQYNIWLILALPVVSVLMAFILLKSL